METDKVKKKYIIVHETVGQSLIKDAGTFAVSLGLIAIGFLIGAEAMEWLGAIIAMMVIVGKALRNKSPEEGISEFYSVEEARAFLDQIKE